MNTIEYESAIADAEMAVRNRPNDPAAFVDLGSAYFEAERYGEAKIAFERAIALKLDFAAAHEKIGHIHYRLGSPAQEAVNAYERAIAIDPHYTISYFGLGILHSTKTGDYDRAVEAFERGLAANPGDAFLTANLGSTYARKGEIEKAIEFIEQAAKLAPDQPFAYGWLNILYLHQKQYAEAARACYRRIEIEEDYNSHRLLGYINIKLGQYEKAIAELERAVALEPGDYEARGALARAYREVGNLDAAEHQYKAGLEMALRDDEYGQSCFHSVYGNIEQALDLVEIGVAKGQVQPGWVRIDPEFIFIKDEPRFQALIR